MGWVFFQGTKEQVRNSRSKRAISVEATEVLLYVGLANSVGHNQTALKEQSDLGLLVLPRLICPSTQNFYSK